MKMRINPILANLYRHFYHHPNDKIAEKIVMFHHEKSALINGQSSWDWYRGILEKEAKKNQVRF